MPPQSTGTLQYEMFAISLMIVVSLALIKSEKILVVVPTPSLSHQMVFSSLVQELTDRDHRVTLITTDPALFRGESSRNLKEIDLHDLSYTLFQKILNEREKAEHDNFLMVIELVYQVVFDVFQQQLRHNSVQKLIRDEAMKFDLLIIEESVTSALIFSHIFEAPVIVLSSFGARYGNIEMMGAASHPILFPSNLYQRLYNLTIWEKINVLYNEMALMKIFKDVESHSDIMLQNLFGAESPTINKLKDNVHMMFLNIHPAWLHNQPVPANVVYTWGIHKTPEKTLPTDLQSYLDSSENGVIYVSFGTNFNTSSMRPELLGVFVKVFSRLPYNILWKWDTDELPGIPDNIKISKWLPQYDVLRHPNLKLFITQGGLQSTEEAIKAGVPLIGFPIFVDQAYNTEKYVYFNIGIKLHLKSLTVEKLDNAITAIFRDYDRYKRNIIQLRTHMQDQPKAAPLEHTLWWIGYVLRHGGAGHLRAPAANMSWADYYELEVVFMSLAALAVAGTVSLLAVRYCFRAITRICRLQLSKLKPY